MKIAVNILIFGIFFLLGKKNRKENQPDIFHLFAVLYMLAFLAFLFLSKSSHLTSQLDEQLSLFGKFYLVYVVGSIADGMYYYQKRLRSQNYS